MPSPRSRSSRTPSRSSSSRNQQVLNLRDLFSPRTSNKSSSRQPSRKNRDINRRDGLGDYISCPWHGCEGPAMMSGGLGNAGSFQAGRGFGSQPNPGFNPQFPYASNQYQMEDDLYPSFPLTNGGFPQPAGFPGGQIPTHRPQNLGPATKSCIHRMSHPASSTAPFPASNLAVPLERNRRPYHYAYPFVESVYGEDEDEMTMAMEQMRLAEQFGDGDGYGVPGQAGYYGGYGGYGGNAGGIGMGCVGAGGQSGGGCLI